MIGPAGFMAAPQAPKSNAQPLAMPVKVSFSCGTYIARIHKATGSCTSDARTAVERAAQKYIANSKHVSILSINRLNDATYEVVFNWGVPK